MPEEDKRPFAPDEKNSFSIRSKSVDGEEEQGPIEDQDPVLETAGITVEDLENAIQFDGRLGTLYLSSSATIAGRETALRQPDDCPDNVYELVKKWLDSHDKQKTTQAIMRAPWFGKAVLEIVWRKGEQWLPRDIIGKPEQWFIFYGDYNELRFLSKNEPEDGEELPPKQFILVQHHATYEKPNGFKIASLCYYSAKFKRDIKRTLLEYIKKYGMPWPVGSVPDNSTDEEIDKYLNILVNMRNKGAAVKPVSYEVDFPHTGGTASNAQIFLDFIKEENKEMTIAASGSHLATDQGETGSRANGQTHAEKEELRAKTYEKMVEGAFNTIIRYIIDVNFGEDVVAPEYYFEGDEDIQADRAERDERLSNQGLKLKKPYYEKAYNLETDEFEISEVEKTTEEIIKTEPGKTAEPGQGKEGIEEEKAKQFSEKDLTGFAEFMSGEFIKRLADAGEFKAQDAFEAMITPLLDQLGKATTHEEVKHILSTTYPDLDTDSMVDLMARGLTASAVQGMGSA